MRVRIQSVGTSVVLKLSGKIIVGSGDERLEEIVEELIEGGAKRIIFDLDRVSYVDSSGLGSMVACRRMAAERGVEVALLRPTGKVHDVLVLTGFREIFQIFQDEAEAVGG